MRLKHLAIITFGVLLVTVGIRAGVQAIYSDAIIIQEQTLPSAGIDNELRHDSSTGDIVRWDVGLSAWVRADGQELNATTIGDGADTDKTITADVGDGGTNPYLFYDASANAWSFSDDGAATATIAAGASTATPDAVGAVTSYAPVIKSSVRVLRDASQVGSFAQADVNTTADTATITAHGFYTGDVIIANGLAAQDPPDPLTQSGGYYVIKVDDDTIQFANTLAEAVSGTDIDLTNTGSSAGNTATDNSNYNILDDDGFSTITMDAGAGKTIYLPTAADNAGRRITFTKTTTGTAALTIDGEGSEAILTGEGSNTSISFGEDYESIEIICDGVLWSLVSPSEVRWEKKVLSTTVSTTTASLTDLNLSSLVVGRTYRLTMAARLVTTGNAATEEILFDGTHNSVTLLSIIHRNDTGANAEVQSWSKQILFVATATTIVFSVTVNGSGNIGSADGQSYVILEELPQHRATSRF